MAFLLNLRNPFTIDREASTYDQIRAFREVSRWSHRSGLLANPRTHLTSGALMFLLGLSMSGPVLNQFIKKEAYDMAPTGTIAAKVGDPASKMRACN